MKRVSAGFLASIAVLVTAASAFGQIQQTGHRVCHNQAGCYVGYQSCDWNQCHSCQSGMHRGQGWGGQCNQCRGGMGAGNFWTRDHLANTCIGRCCATKAFPDAGFAPPVRLPVNYDSAWYGSYHPQAYYGNPGGGFVANYPVVYQPTDTTQLGYYYHNVPTWQSRPGMIPPTPCPSDYHVRMCLPERDCLHGHGGCYGGDCYGGHYGAHGSSCQNCNDGYAMAQPHFMTPNGQQTVRPAVAQKQGLLGGFRFASLTRLFD